MKTVEILTLPRIRFAHAYGTEVYSNHFPIIGNRIEVTVITEGSLTLEKNGKIYVANKGDVICNRFEIPTAVSASAPHRHHTVCATVEWTETERIDGLCLPLVTPSVCGTGEAKNLIDEFVRTPLHYTDSPTRGGTAFLNLLCALDRCNRRGKKQNLPGEVLYTQRAKEYVQSRLQEPIRQKDVAAHLSVTPEYLCAIFRKTEGVTLIKYVNTAKLEAIKALMEKERLRLREAAPLFGFSDPNYVSRLYKKYYGHNLTETEPRDGEK